MSLEIAGTVAVVTGASRGIGRAIAEALAREGSNVVLAARDAQRIAELAEHLRLAHGVRTLAVPTDVSDAAQVTFLIEEAERTLGGVDILINNAGMGIYGAVDEVNVEDLRHVFDVNFFGAVAAMQAVVPVMRRRGGGVIVNVSSIVGKIPSPLGGGYTATKYALEGISGAARAELVGDDIHVIVVRPGLTQTDFARNARVSVPGAEWMEGESQAPIKGIPAERVARRTVQAIQRNEREVYVTWFDRLVVWGAQLFPGPFAWGLRLATWVRRRRFAQAQAAQRTDRSASAASRQTGEKVKGITLSQWALALLILGGVVWSYKRR